MGNEFTGFEDNAPTLTLEPDLGEPKAEIAAEPEAEAVKKEMEQTVLSPEEQQMVDSFAKKIDIENTNQILQYGAGTQKKMADFSDAALENVRTQDLGEVAEDHYLPSGSPDASHEGFRSSGKNVCSEPELL